MRYVLPSALLVVVAALTVAACSAESDRPPAPPPTETGAAAGVRPETQQSPAETVTADTPQKRRRVVPPSGSDWFAVHQSPDGSWSARDFVTRCGEAQTGDTRCSETPCDGAVDWMDDAEATGLALLTLSSDGETHNSGQHKEHVKAGLRWLIVEQQSEDGRLPVDDGDERAHAVATLALAEAYGLSGSRSFEEPATRAVSALLAARRPGGGWPARTGDAAADLDTTVWATFALRSAQMAELQNGAAEPLVGDAELDAASGALRRFGVPAEQDVRTCAMLVAARVYAGEDPTRVDELVRGLERLREAGLDPDGELDPYAVYFGANATWQGPDPAWLVWRTGLQGLRRRCWNWPDPVEGARTWPLPATGPSAEAGRLRTVALLSMAFRIIARYRHVFRNRSD